MEKKFQVFVSSTFLGLEDERQEVMRVLLELGHMPTGMEFFPAANETQWSLIKKVIDDCDYFILILAGRYGSIGLGGKSYTEMEYQYALSINKPTIPFIHSNPGKIFADKTEITEEGKDKLARFRTSVETMKHCKYWDTPQGLGSVVSTSLAQLIKSEPAIGWVRANKLTVRDTTVELPIEKSVSKNMAFPIETLAPKDAVHLYKLMWQFEKWLRLMVYVELYARDNNWKEAIKKHVNDWPPRSIEGDKKFRHM